MLFRSPLVLLATCLAAGVSLSAQTLLSDFSSSAGFGTSGSLVGNGVYVISGGVANYTVSTNTANDQAYLPYTGAVGSYTSNWSVRIDVFYNNPTGIFDAGVEQGLNVGIGVFPTGSTIGFNLATQTPSYNAFGVTYNIFHNGAGGYSREFRPGYFVANTVLADDTSRYSQSSLSSGSSGSLQITFDASTKMLVASYDVNGPNGGYSFTTMNAFSQDSVNAATWGMGANDTFSIYIDGNSLRDGGSGLGPIISLSEVRVDNLYGTGLSAVPEPSTYAAVAGALALGLAAWKRRRTLVAN